MFKPRHAAQDYTYKPGRTGQAPFTAPGDIPGTWAIANPNDFELFILCLTPLMIWTVFGLDVYVLITWVQLYRNLKTQGCVSIPDSNVKTFCTMATVQDLNHRMAIILPLAVLNLNLNIAAVYYHLKYHGRNSKYWVKHRFFPSTVLMLSTSCAIASLTFPEDFVAMAYTVCGPEILKQQRSFRLKPAAWLRDFATICSPIDLVWYVNKVSWGIVGLVATMFLLTVRYIRGPKTEHSLILRMWYILLDDVLFALTSPVWLAIDILAWITLTISKHWRGEVDETKSGSWTIVTGRWQNFNKTFPHKATGLGFSVKYAVYQAWVKVTRKRANNATLVEMQKTPEIAATVP